VCSQEADAVFEADAVPQEDAAVHEAEEADANAEEVVFTLNLL
jgi:hypothetical protein